MGGFSFARRLLAACALCAVTGSAAGATATVTYYYTDGQGTVLMTADTNGNPVSTTDFRPYGLQAIGTDVSGPAYTGHVNDADTNLIYMQARYYDPVLARFLSKDPAPGHAGNVDEFNIYSYVANNPLRRTDPDGKQTAEDYAKLSSCPVQCSLVHDAQGQWMAVPTAAAGQSFAAAQMGTTMGALNPATPEQLAKGSDAGSASLSAASLATAANPPLAAALDGASTALAVVSLVLAPTSERALNVATTGFYGGAKLLAKGSEPATKIIEVTEKTQKITDTIDQVNKLSDGEKKPSDQK